MEMDDDIFHLGIIHGALSGAPPRVLGFLVSIVEANHVDLGQIFEIEPLRIPDSSAEYQMHFAHVNPPSIATRAAMTESISR
jgi:hypothetical protein